MYFKLKKKSVFISICMKLEVSVYSINEYGKLLMQLLKSMYLYQLKSTHAAAD